MYQRRPRHAKLSDIPEIGKCACLHQRQSAFQSSCQTWSLWTIGEHCQPIVLPDPARLLDMMWCWCIRSRIGMRSCFIRSISSVTCCGRACLDTHDSRLALTEERYTVESSCTGKSIICLLFRYRRIRIHQVLLSQFPSLKSWSHERHVLIAFNTVLKSDRRYMQRTANLHMQ